MREVGTISNPYGIHNKEYGGKIYVCTRPREPWGKLWPSLLQGPVFVDHPSGQPQRKGEEYILWDN